jgi:hypothetical protein
VAMARIPPTPGGYRIRGSLGFFRKLPA